jgi:hypothetical protein
MSKGEFRMTLTTSRLTPRRGSAITILSSIAVLALAGALAGCGVTLDMDAISKSITSGVATQTGIEIASVTCPQETRAGKTGDTFDCTATPKIGGKLTIKVTQKDDKGNIDWALDKVEGLLSLQTVESAVAKGIKDQTQADATVNCGGKFRAEKAGDTFDCQVTAADGTKSTVTVTEKDAEGNVSWALKGQPADAAAPAAAPEEGGEHQ